MKILSHILRLLFPPQCVVCNKTATYLCSKCSTNIDKPFGTNDGIISIFSYQDPRIKKLLWKLKFKGIFSIAETLGEYAYDSIMEELSDDLFFEGGEQKIILIPIPLSKKRFRERGFNQAEKIAHAIATKNKDLFTVDTQTLIRIKDTPPQSTLNKRSIREQNMKDCFEVKNKNMVQNSFVIIVDDITTTGATINEAQKVLRKAGVRKMIGLTVAH